MLKKILQKFKYYYSKYKRILITRFKSYTKTSDYERWSQSKSLQSSWDERTFILAEYIEPNAKVFEFGAAKLQLKKALPHGCEYLHSDIVSRAPDTYVFDLNKELPMIPNVDVIVFSGVLEYVFNVEQLLEHLSRFTNQFVFSYATTNAFSEINKRRFHGWVSDLSLLDIKQLAYKMEWQCEQLGSWKSQTLFKMTK